MSPAAGLPIRFRPLQPGDFDLVVEWRQRTHVIAHFGRADRGEIEFQLMERLESGWRFPNIVVMGTRPIGYFEYFVAGLVSEDFGLDETKGLIGLEFYIGEPELLAKGIGKAIVSQAAMMLFREDAVTGLLVRHAGDNAITTGLLRSLEFTSSTLPDGVVVMRRDRPPSG